MSNEFSTSVATTLSSVSLNSNNSTKENVTNLQQQSNGATQNNNNNNNLVNGKSNINNNSKVQSATTNTNGHVINGNAKQVKNEWVRLNIGGKYFVTTKTTLCKDPQSFFFKLCQDDPSIGLTTDKVIYIYKYYLFIYFFLI